MPRWVGPRGEGSPSFGLLRRDSLPVTEFGAVQHTPVPLDRVGLLEAFDQIARSGKPDVKESLCAVCRHFTFANVTSPRPSRFARLQHVGDKGRLRRRDRRHSPSMEQVTVQFFAHPVPPRPPPRDVVRFRLRSAPVLITPPPLSHLADGTRSPADPASPKLWTLKPGIATRERATPDGVTRHLCKFLAAGAVSRPISPAESLQ